jgi:hypothetical protein
MRGPYLCRPVRLSACLSFLKGTDQGLPLLSLSLGFCGFGCGLSFLSGVTTLLGSLGGLLSSSLFWANAPADTMPSITTAQNFRINFFISSLSLLMLIRAHGKEKETRRPALSKMGAKRRRPARTSFSLSEVYQQNCRIAPFRVNSHGIVQRLPVLEMG